MGNIKTLGALGAGISAAVVTIALALTTSSAATTTPAAYWGAYMDGNDTYTYLYGGTWRDAPWDSKTWAKFESNAGKKVSIVHWGAAAPWNKPFTDYKSTFELVRNAGDINAVDISTGSVPLADIANKKYDASLLSWFRAAAAWGHPFFLLPDVEMNGRWEPYSPGKNGNTPAGFIAMWRHMHDLAVQAGAKITWVWVPNIDPYNLFTPYSQLYPGDSYVDWTGLDGFNAGGTNWHSFSTLYKPSYNVLLSLAPTKPIMVSQIGSEEGGGSKANWIATMLSALPTSYPRIKALLWFNWRILKSGVWANREIESSASSQAAFKQGIVNPYYLQGGSYASLPAGKVPTP